MKPLQDRPPSGNDQEVIVCFPTCPSKDSTPSSSPTPEPMADMESDELAQHLLTEVYRFRYERFDCLARYRTELVQSWMDYYPQYQAWRGRVDALLTELRGQGSAEKANDLARQLFRDPIVSDPGNFEIRYSTGFGNECVTIVGIDGGRRGDEVAEAGGPPCTALGHTSVSPRQGRDTSVQESNAMSPSLGGATKSNCPCMQCDIHTSDKQPPPRTRRPKRSVPEAIEETLATRPRWKSQHRNRPKHDLGRVRRGAGIRRTTNKETRDALALRYLRDAMAL